ncbi:MAG: glycosyltransferase family 4 protein [Lewinella sp.]|nr:glycosyltransferase family 4 protein [Lewinella sp.]
MSMRVLVISNYDDNYNAVRPEGELFIGLHRAGVDVQIMTFGDTPFARRFREEGLRVIDYHPTKKFSREAVIRIREAILAEDRQIVHLFNNKAIVSGIRAARGLPVKVATYRGYTGNIHWWDPSCYLTHLHPRVDGISCVSEAVKEVFDRQLFFRKEKAVTVSKGHDPAWYADVPTGDLGEFGFSPQDIVISVVANARRMKGIPYLLEAMTMLPADLPLRFLLIGRGLDDEATLKALTQSGLRDRVTFAGFRKDVLALVRACDISLLPSVKGEGLSKVLLESLFLARPTIMTDIGGNRGLAVHGESALIIPPRDPAAMADAIRQLATDTDLRRRMGEAGQAYISTHYNVERSVREMKAFYEGLLAG